MQELWKNLQTTTSFILNLHKGDFSQNPKTLCFASLCGILTLTYWTTVPHLEPTSVKRKGEELWCCMTVSFKLSMAVVNTPCLCLHSRSNVGACLCFTSDRRSLDVSQTRHCSGPWSRKRTERDKPSQPLHTDDNNTQHVMNRKRYTISYHENVLHPLKWHRPGLGTATRPRHVSILQLELQ